MKQRRKLVHGWLVLLAGATLCGHAVATPILDQTGNSLGNGSFESGSTNMVTGSGGMPSAASTWRQWENSGNGAPSSELITDAEMMSAFGLGIIDGGHALRVITQGGSDGLFSFNSYGHPGWNLYDAVTFSAWVYVVSGTMQVAVGSNQNGFSGTLASAASAWQFISVTSAAGQLNNEPLLYSVGGASEFIVDAAWLNNGLTSTHPLQTSSTQVPEPPMLGLFLSGALFLMASRRRRFVKI